MKLKHLTLIFAGALLSLFCGKAYAQAPEIEEEIVVVDFIPEGKTYYYSPLPRDNWFMSMGVGVQTLFAEHKGKSLFSLSMTVDFGKWFNPYWGLRLSATGGALRLRTFVGLENFPVLVGTAVFLLGYAEIDFEGVHGLIIDKFTAQIGHHVAECAHNMGIAVEERAVKIPKIVIKFHTVILSGSGR